MDSWSWLRVQCKPPFFLFLNCELDVGGHLVEVCMEGLQVPFSMGPDDEGIVNIRQPESGVGQSVGPAPPGLL